VYIVHESVCLSFLGLMRILLHEPRCNLGSSRDAPWLCTVGQICNRCTARTRYVSEYLFVLAIGLVYVVLQSLLKFIFFSIN